MILSIDKNGQDPIYLQIRNQIVSAVAKGELVEGDSLPSVRNLARDLGVNLHTINKAYAVLQDEGYVAMNGRRGTNVMNPAKNAGPGAMKEVENRVAAALEQLAMEYRACGGSAQGFVALAAKAVEDVKEQ